MSHSLLPIQVALITTTLLAEVDVSLSYLKVQRATVNAAVNRLTIRAQFPHNRIILSEVNSTSKLVSLFRN